jgi:hypothetical protein
VSAEEFHKHRPKDVKPQGENSGLDADKVDGKHASELGGGEAGNDPWQDTSKERIILLPSYYDSVTGPNITRKPGYWQCYVPVTPVYQFVRSAIVPNGIAPAVFDKNPEFLVDFSMAENGASNLLYIVICCGTEITGANKKFGVKVSGSTMYVITSNGTQKATTQVKTGLAAGFHKLRVKLTSGMKIQVWLDSENVVEETEVAKLPSGQHSGADLYFAHGHNNSGDWANYIYQPLIMWDK